MPNIQALFRSIRVPGLLCAAPLLLPACAAEEPAEPDESRQFVVTIKNITPPLSVYLYGTFETPESEELAGPLEPGESYVFEISAAPEARLQLMTMLIQSNDAFVAFEAGGIALWDEDGELLVGDRSDELVLYDAGTEANELPGAGMFQGATQADPSAGDEGEGQITSLSADEPGPAGHSFPAVEDFVALEITHLEGWRFEVELRNTSPADLLPLGENSMQPASLSPGVYTVHEEGLELFTPGVVAPPSLEPLAEAGDPAPVIESLELHSGVSSPLSPVVWAVHDGDVRLYDPESVASRGIQQLAEDGDPSVLLDDLADHEEVDAHDVAITDDTHEEVAPGETVELYFRASPGDRVSFVTAYLAANDKFLGSGLTGIPLFDEQGEARVGDTTWTMELLDAGTEFDEIPGLGPNQFNYQPEPGAGLPEEELVRKVEGEFMGHSYPLAEEIVRVEIDLQADVDDE